MSRETINKNFIESCMPKICQVVSDEIDAFYPSGIKGQDFADTISSLGATFWGNLIENIYKITNAPPNIDALLLQFKNQLEENFASRERKLND